MGLKEEMRHPASVTGDSIWQPAASQVVGHDSLPMLGGPTTNDGKTGSRRNALKHGMPASTLLPEVLQPGRVAQLRGQLFHSDGFRAQT
jgi:hypothetical protein